MDIDKSNWLKAVQKYKIPWISSSDLNGADGEVVKMFGIKSIPKLFFLSHERKLLSVFDPDKNNSQLEDFIDFIRDTIKN